MRKGRRIAVVVALAFAALLSSGACAYWYFLLRTPLAGDTYHDFGEVPLGEGITHLEHTFNLSNRLSKPLNIVGLRPDCGCLTVNDMRLTLQPGDTLNVPIRLQAKIGERLALIHVLFDDDTQATLKVHATGRPLPVLRMANLAQGASVALSADGTAEFAVALDTYATYDAPALPAIASSHSALSAEFIDASWTLEYRPKDVKNAPTTWQARVRVRFAGDTATLPADASITLDGPPAKRLVIGVRTSAQNAATTAPTAAQPVESQ